MRRPRVRREDRRHEGRRRRNGSSDWETLTPTYSGQFFKDVLAGRDIDVAGTTAVDGGAADAPVAAVDAPAATDAAELDAGA